MRVIKSDPSQWVPFNAPVFLGEVSRRQLVVEGDYRVVEVTARNGMRSKFHSHGSEQLLIITAGAGIVGTRTEQWEVGPGDIVLTPAHETHFHGALPGKDVTHYSILGPDGELTIEED